MKAFKMSRLPKHTVFLLEKKYLTENRQLDNLNYYYYTLILFSHTIIIKVIDLYVQM